jgi:hypothetical protein
MVIAPALLRLRLDAMAKRPGHVGLDQLFKLLQAAAWILAASRCASQSAAAAAQALLPSQADLAHPDRLGRCRRHGRDWFPPGLGRSPRSRASAASSSIW